jgi:hypothetical protein
MVGHRVHRRNISGEIKKEELIHGPVKTFDAKVTKKSNESIRFLLNMSTVQFFNFFL